MKEYVNQHEAARVLGVSPVTVWRWIEQGQLKPAAYVVGKDNAKAPVFDMADLRRKLDERQLAKTA